MSRRLPAAWVPRLLFRITLGLSGGLLLLLLLAPVLARVAMVPAGAAQVVGLFAHDATLRRTALASGLGLVVTACVFFRPPNNPSRPASRRPKAAPPPFSVGA